MRVSKQELIDAEQRIRAFIKKEAREPNIVTMQDMDTGRDVDIPIREVNGLYYNTYIFWLKNGRYPNYATINIEKGEPTIQDYQDRSTTCCPASMSMAASKLFKPTSESTFAKVLGTNSKGTTPQNLVAKAPELGFDVKAIPRNLTSVQTALSQYKAVLTHYQTGPADCSGFINDYGHYALIRGVGSGRYEIWDPTKGRYTCPASMMDQATNGRSLYYYTVSLR